MQVNSRIQRFIVAAATGAVALGLYCAPGLAALPATTQTHSDGTLTSVSAEPAYDEVVSVAIASGEATGTSVETVTTSAAPTSVVFASFARKGTLAARTLSPTRANGRWTWWGYRTNAYETWAIATQPSSTWVSWVPIFGQYVKWQARVWRLTAQNARMMGQCLGIAWSGSGIIVGCA